MSSISYPPSAPFWNRVEAGQRLAGALSTYKGQPNTLVLALPRGGVPVAAEISSALQLPLDVCLVRKLGVPSQPELAMGAIASSGIQVLNWDVIQRMHIPERVIERVAVAETKELARRDRTYRQGRPQLNVTGKTLLLVDDGVATGSTLKAAIAVLKAQQPKRIIVAVPVAPPTTLEELRQEVDDIVCLEQPEPLYSISVWYRNFDQTSDETVCRLLQSRQKDEKFPSS